MITLERYTALTGDTASEEADIEAAIIDAQALLEEFLSRPLANEERTESLWPDRHGRLWPKATPITEVDGSYEIDGLALVGASPFFGVFGSASAAVEVTYTGGWDAPDEATPSAPILPTCLQRDLAFAAYRLLHPTIAALASLTPGAESVRLGDAAVSGKHLGAAEDTDSWWSKRTRGYRYAPVGTAQTRSEALL